MLPQLKNKSLDSFFLLYIFTFYCYGRVFGLCVCGKKKNILLTSGGTVVQQLELSPHNKEKKKGSGFAQKT